MNLGLEMSINSDSTKPKATAKWMFFAALKRGSNERAAAQLFLFFFCCWCCCWCCPNCFTFRHRHMLACWEEQGRDEVCASLCVCEFVCELVGTFVCESECQWVLEIVHVSGKMREREREFMCVWETGKEWVCMCVCVWVSEWVRERARERK